MPIISTVGRRKQEVMVTFGYIASWSPVCLKTTAAITKMDQKGFMCTEITPLKPSQRGEGFP